jgi:hypothetical protein
MSGNNAGQPACRKSFTGQRLGSTRGAVYDDFITRLMTPTPFIGTRPEHHAGTRGDIEAPAWHDPAVAERVVALSTMSPAELRMLLTQVADRRRESSPARSVMDILLEEPLTELPGGVLVKWWRAQRRRQSWERRSGSRMITV